MYEQYTDKQIVEMLMPKLKKSVPELNWDEYLKRPDDFSIWSRLISVIYKSGYASGQLGRSFIIGEKKKEIKAERGAKVCWFSNDHDTYYPNTIGTIGTIKCVDCDGDLWVDWPFGSCEVNKGTTTDTCWCCNKNQCLLIDTNVRGNIKKGDKIVYLGTERGFLTDSVWPDRVATGVVDIAEINGCLVNWDNPSVINDTYNGRTHVWYEDIAKVIPWN